MTTDDILRMAREAGFSPSIGRTDKGGKYHPNVNALGKTVPIEWVERFAALVAASEREQCAEVAKGISDKYAFGHYGNEVDTADEIADAIRARGKT